MFLNLLQGDQGNPLTAIIMIGIMVVFVVIIIWNSVNNKKRNKEYQEKLGGIKIGYRVKTIGGICGFVVQINDDENTIVLETGLEEQKSYIKFDKQAIYDCAPPKGSEVETEQKKEEKPAEEKAPAKKSKASKKKDQFDE